jgi:hypothetical protein
LLDFFYRKRSVRGDICLNPSGSFYETIRYDLPDAAIRRRATVSGTTGSCLQWLWCLPLHAETLPLREGRSARP